MRTGSSNPLRAPQLDRLACRHGMKPRASMASLLRESWGCIGLRLDSEGDMGRHKVVQG